MFPACLTVCLSVSSIPAVACVRQRHLECLSSWLASGSFTERSSHLRLLQAKLLSSERALVVAKSGLEGASAQASALRQQLSTEQRRISTLSTDLKHAGSYPLPELPSILSQHPTHPVMLPLNCKY